jgi:hypothetical protein
MNSYAEKATLSQSINVQTAAWGKVRVLRLPRGMLLQ